MPDLSVEEVKKEIDAKLAYLQRKTDLLAAAEDRYVAEQADDVPIRDARDASATELVELTVRARSRVLQVFGANALVQYGFEGETPRLPSKLAPFVLTVVQLLRGAPQEASDDMGGTVSTVAIADALDARRVPLQAHLDALVREKRENEAALTLRDRATEEWRRAYRSAAMFLAAYYEMAGRRDLADRIRPTVRREAGFEPTPPEPDPASPAAS